jgi:hypothetical protein
MMTAAADAQIAQRPLRRVGDNWMRSDGVEFTVVKSDKHVVVLRTDRTGHAAHVHMTQDLNDYDVTDLDGRPIPLSTVFLGPQWRYFDWPLEVGKSWAFQATAYVKFTEMQTMNMRTTVRAYEDVRTTAGTFKAFRLLREWHMHWPTFGGSGTRWVTTDWYASEAKTVVKHVSMGPYSGDWELVHLSIQPPELPAEGFEGMRTKQESTAAVSGDANTDDPTMFSQAVTTASPIATPATRTTETGDARARGWLDSALAEFCRSLGVGFLLWDQQLGACLAIDLSSDSVYEPR